MTCFVWAAAHLAFGLPLNRVLVPLGKRATSPATTEPASTLPVRRNGVQKHTALLLALVFAVTWFTSTAMAAHLPRILQDAGDTPVAAVAAAALVDQPRLRGGSSSSVCSTGSTALGEACIRGRSPGAVAVIVFGATSISLPAESCAAWELHGAATLALEIHDRLRRDRFLWLRRLPPRH
jgi:hypothetical protein